MHFHAALKDYRAKVNREGVIVDIAPYRSAMVPPQDSDTHYISGRSDQVLAYIARTVQGFAPLVERVEAMPLIEETEGGIASA
ncbi:hypothetical protein ABEX25_01135 [Paenibacillus thiaminolyticus]|uniref:hypothetical protein n=1 Tax=Paenibacillus thiaminolyticus TaxID=49283 RepID=UPI003D2B8484